MIIEAAAGSGSKEGQDLAIDLATTWIRSNHLGYTQTGHMHEKYSAVQPGKSGGGGEYAPQVGFGWSNGVVLDLLKQYGSQL